MEKKIHKLKPVVYIFCEGKTEEKYFTKLSRILNSSFKIYTIDLGGGTIILNHPDKLKKKVTGTIRHDQTSGLTQKVFIVFDLDIFIDKSKLQNTQNVLKDFDLIYNNECFEYWILSHFQKYDLGGGKKNYLAEIRTVLPKLPPGKDYKMTGDEDFDWLHNIQQVKNAIQNVKSVNKTTGNLKDRDPYSNVYKIIEYLEK